MKLSHNLSRCQVYDAMKNGGSIRIGDLKDSVESLKNNTTRALGIGKENQVDGENVCLLVTANYQEGDVTARCLCDSQHPSMRVDEPNSIISVFLPIGGDMESVRVLMDGFFLGAAYIIKEKFKSRFSQSLIDLVMP